MGWVSTREDIIERVNDAAYLLSNPNTIITPDTEIPMESVQSMIYRAHCLAHELKKLLSIATDPSIDLAHALADANSRVGDLTNQVQ
jgi:hypothetical protein